MVVYNFFKAKFLLFILLPALVLGFSDNTKAQQEAMVVQAIGTGIIRGKDVATARNDALSNAMVATMQLALADLIPKDTLVSHFKTIDESIFAASEEYILEYKVLAENSTGKTYRILVEATLFSEKIQQLLSKLEGAPTEMDVPKVLFFLAEQNIDDIMPSYWWGEDPVFVKGHSEKAVAKALIDRGFSVIDHQVMLPYQSDMTYINNPYLTHEEAIQLGNRLEADILVLGTAVAETMPYSISQTSRTFKAELSIRAVRSDTGEEIASADHQATTVSDGKLSGGREALSKAGALAGKELAEKIAQSWTYSEGTAGKIEIFVQGTGDLPTFVGFRKSLSQLTGIKNLRIKEAMADEALIWVDYTGSAQELAESLKQESFDDFRMTIFEVGRKHISMRLIPGQRSRPY